MSRLATFIAALSVALPVQAETIHVPDPQNGIITIQDGIDAANAATNDVVEVADGIYTGEGNVNLDFGGKAITVKSQNGPENCIIRGESGTPASAFIFHSMEGRDSRVSGFTIDDFDNPGPEGAGVLIYNGSPTIAGCIFINCDGFDGGGAEVRGGAPLFVACFFTQNTATLCGGGMLVSNGDINCTFTNNSAVEFGGAVYNTTGSAPDATNCIFWADSPDEIIQIGGVPTISYSNYMGGVPGAWDGGGNIDVDPMFVDAGNSDYRPAAGSPVIDAADSTAVPNDVTEDVDGGARFVDDPDTDDTGNGPPPIVDMGAYEFQLPCPEDLDGSGAVDFGDIVRVLAAWGNAGGPEDLDGSGTVDFGDIVNLLAVWGPCP